MATLLEKELGFQNFIADPNLWMKKTTKTNGDKYYIYICVYVDNLLCLTEDPKKYILRIKKYVPIQYDSIKISKMS